MVFTALPVDEVTAPGTWDFKAGDTGKAIMLLGGVDTSGTLDAVSAVSGVVWPVADPSAAVALTGAVEDSAALTVYLTIDTWLAGVGTPVSYDDPDEYMAYVTVTTPGGARVHPEQGYMLWRVWLAPTA